MAGRASRRREQLGRALPIVQWASAYRRTDLRGDLLAGGVVAALMIPQALGYARIAGVPVQVGLYAIPLALLAYAVLGSSRQLMVGPASTVAIVSGSLVADIAPGDPAEAIKVTAALAIATGVVLVTIGLLRVGWVAEFLSKPIVTGFVIGLALTIIVGELPTLLGVAKPPGDLIGVLVRTLRELDQTDARTLAVSVAALTVLIGGAAVVPRVPWGLVVLVVGIVVSNLLDLASKGVATVGEVPAGLPPFGLPLVRRDELGAVAAGGVSLALVALAEGLAASRLFAARGGYRVRTEPELIGMGGANVAAGLSGGMAVAGSLSKTAAAAQAGSRSQLTGVTAAVFAGIVLVAFTWCLTGLPRAVLSAIVVAAVWGLIDVRAVRRYARNRQLDLLAAVVAAAAVVLFGPLTGLGIAIAVSLLGIIYRSSRPRLEVLGRIDSEKAAWGRLRLHTDRRAISGVLVVRLDAPLFWANATAIEERLLEELDHWADTRVLVLDLEATTELDTTSVDALTDLLHELRSRGIELYLARVLHTANAVLDRSGFLDLLGSEHVWHSISQCVRAARRQTGLKHRHGADVADVDDKEAGEEHQAVAVDWVNEIAALEAPDLHNSAATTDHDDESDREAILEEISDELPDE
jgi:high affinity sulfate transporter 1